MIRMIPLKELDLLADVLKAGQHFHKFCLVVFRDGARHIGGHNGGYHCRIFGHLACSRPLPHNIFRDQHAGHISGKGNILAGRFVFRINTQSVGIGICRKHHIRILLLRQLQCQRKCLRIFRVRVIQGGKIRIGQFLLGHDIHMLKAQLGENPSYRHVACPVERRVNDPDIVSHLLNHFRMDDLLFQFFHVSVVDLFSDHLIQSFIHGFLLIHGFHVIVIRHRTDFFDDFAVSGRSHLCTVLPVCLIAVILRRIMACRHYDTGNAAKFSDRKGKFRCGTQRVKHISLDAVCRHAQSRLIRKLGGHPSGIISNCHTLLLAALFQNIVCKPLSGFSYRIDIHAVRARADHPSETARTEFQFLVKTIFNLAFISRNTAKLLLCRFIKVCIR